MAKSNLDKIRMKDSIIIVIAFIFLIMSIGLTSAIVISDCQAVATNGSANLSVVGNWCIYKYDYIGNFGSSNQTADTFGVVSGNLNVSVLVVAGGGAGGSSDSGGGGGGGAGGLIYNNSYIVSGSVDVKIGAGGKQGLNSRNNGTNSSFGVLQARGGGSAASGSNAQATFGSEGGSGGGGQTGGAPTYGGAGTPGQGNYGGGNIFTNGNYPTGGGGGSSQAGRNGSSTIKAGDGGNGTQLNISGSLVYYAGGGGGGMYDGGTGGTGGLGGGGNGIAAGGTAGSAVNGTGGGGGGAGQNGQGGHGGSGVVIVAYQITSSNPTLNIVYPTNTTYTSIVSAINYTFVDANSNTCYYSLDDFATNTSMTCGNNITGLTSNQGSNRWSVFINNTAGLYTMSNVSFFVDSINPTIDFIAPTPDNYYNSSTNSFTLNITGNDTNRANATIVFTNSSGTTNYSMTCTGTTTYYCNYTFTSLTDGYYNYTTHINDTLGNNNNTEKRTITIDKNNPLISFGTGTEVDYYNASRSNIYVNISLTEPTLSNITFTLKNDEGIYNQTTFTDRTLIINWTLLPNDNYTYYVNATSILNNKNSTGVRHISLDTANPIIIVNEPPTPTTGSYQTNKTQNFSFNGTDVPLGIKNATLIIYDNKTGLIVNQTVMNNTGTPQVGFWSLLLNFVDGIYTWFVKAYDFAGNIFMTSNESLNIITLLDTTSGGENLTYNSSVVNITRYLVLPGNTTAVTSAYINISSMLFDYLECSQETANKSEVGDCSITLNYTGVYSWDGVFGAPGYLYDADWDSQTGPTGAGTFYINYSKPNNNFISSAKWKVKDNNGTVNVTIPSDCMVSSYLVLKAVSDGSDMDFQCWNTSSWKSLRHTYIAQMFEEQIIWNYSNSNLSNPYMFIGNTNVWNHTGIFSGINNKSSIATPINQYITSTYYNGTNYLIPFTFGSSGNGTLRYFDFNYNISGLLENSQIYNATTYETSSENFNVNITYDSLLYSSISALFVYNGTSYAATKTGSGNNILFSKNIIIPVTISASENRSFFWNISVGATNVLTSTKYQTVNAINFARCNTTANVTYINYTFKDEGNSSYITAGIDLLTLNYGLSSSNSKQYIFTDLVLNSSFAFCMNPGDRPVQAEWNYLQYSATGYPQRQYYSTGTLTNATTNVTLYLLSASTGIYSSVQTMNTVGTPVTNVTIVVERQISGNWITIAQGNTDSSGLATFWVNPNYDHRYTATKSGYVPTVVTNRPTQSVYSIIMGGGTTNASYVSSTEGVSYTRTPTDGIRPSGSTLFTFNITSSVGNMVNCRFDLTYANDTIIETTSSACLTNAYLTITRAFTSGQNIKGKYYVDMGSGYVLLEGDGNWIFRNSTTTTWATLKSFFTLLSDKAAWGVETATDQKDYEFTIIVIFFLVVAILASALNIGFSYDLYSPGYFLFILPVFMWIASISGGVFGEGLFYIQGSTFSHFTDNYIIAIFSTLLAIGVFLAGTRRDA